MSAKKLRRSRREYGVEDEAGNTLINPSATTKGAARVAAARLAEGLGESIYVFEVGEDRDGGSRIIVGREEIRPPAEPLKSRAQINREIDEVLTRKSGGVLGGLTRNVSADHPMESLVRPAQGSTRVQSRPPNADARKQAFLEDAIEAVYNRKGSEDLTLAEACEAVRELLPSSSYWSRADVSDKTIATTIKHQIPYWF